MEQRSIISYSEAIKAIKSAILQSRYRAAALANREMLSLYFGIGKYISENSREGTGEQAPLKPYRRNYSKNCRG
ncbi:MAG: hypothetical protein LBR26_15745 [Prevotella sp.]|jgi:hypothetical protein|nr:hypothetical protein [Prevotella sp.]